MYKRILVATDGSTLSKKAVSSAVALAQLSGAELVALKVVPRYPQSYFEGGLALPLSDINKIEKQWAAHGQAVHLFDPLAADGRTARFNPLAYIDRSSPIEVLDELQKIAGMLFTAPERTDPSGPKPRARASSASGPTSLRPRSCRSRSARSTASSRSAIPARASPTSSPTGRRRTDRFPQAA